MKKNAALIAIVLCLTDACTAWAGGGASPGHSLFWHADRETLDANLKDAGLIQTLEDLALQTGWHIYLEPVPGKTFTAQFEGLARGPAMRSLLGELNYTFVPQPEGVTHLLVFRTSRAAATVEIAATPGSKVQNPAAATVPNQLIVKLKPGARIEEIAARLGARVKGRIGELNAYLIEFEDAASLEAARKELATHSDVESTELNYYLDRPTMPQPATGNLAPPVQLRLNPGSKAGKVVVGLIDTAMQPLGNGLDQFMLPQISVAGEAGASDGMSHGTAMAETVLRALQVASAGQTGVQILPVDVYGPNQTATTFDVASGIIRALNSTPSPSIINLSLVSNGESALLRQVIQQASSYGVVFFASAGNTPVATPLAPSMWPEVHSVTASDGAGRLAGYANRASTVDIMAPGNSVIYFAGRAYQVTGTSAASAYAAGLAAALADAHGLTVQEAASTVQRSLPFTATRNP